jgi:outer membrane receptor protein involved in Fe transport
MRHVRVFVVVSMLMVLSGLIAMAQESEQAVEQIPETIDQEASAATFEEEITVTGTLIPRPSLDSLSPVTVLDAPQELTLSGTTRIEDLMVSLPQVYPGQNSTIANGATGIASIDLRNLGTVRTLVLLNGRRLAFGDPWGVDVNAVPAPLVKRIDVLTGGASTVYGSDAVAGVVNFVLDTDFTGVRGGVQYSVYQHDNNNTFAQELNEAAGFDYPSGTTWDGGALNAYIALGGSFADGRGHGSVYVDYRKIDELVKASRDYLNCAVAASDDGPYCGGSGTIPRGRFMAFGPNWEYVGDFVLTLAEEGGDGHSFRPRNDEYFNYGPYNHIQRPDEKWNAGGFAHYTINDHFEPYLEVMFMHDYTDAQIAPSASFGTVNQINCDNPMLSDQQRELICTQPGYGPDDYATVFVMRRNVEGDARTSQLSNTSFRLVAGLRGDIDDSWSYDLYGLHAESMYQERYVNDLNIQRLANALDIVVDPITGEWVCRSGDPGCVPWDIFREGAVTQEAIDYISAVAMMSNSARTRVLNLTFTGDLEAYGLALPSASEGLQIAVGAEYRSEFFEIQPDEVMITGAAGFPGGVEPLSADYDVNELFIEALVPFVQDTRGFRDLSLELGYRYSDYSTSGGFNTYKGLLNWAITDSWRLRGGYNRAVRAPTIFELFFPQDRTPESGDICENDVHTGVPEGTLEQCLRTGVSEEQYGNIPSQGGMINAIWGGNPLLEPEVADTVTAGVVWTPQAIPGLSVTADYYDIEITEAIDYLWADFIISFCADTGDPHLCSLIHRDQAGTLWLSPDAYVDETYQNIGLRKSEGVDFNVNYLIGLGDAGYLNTGLIGTYLLSQRLANPSYDFDCAGYFGDLCGQPSARWRHRLRATWETNFNLNLSLTWRRIGSVEIDAASTDPDLADAERLEEARINGIDTTRAYDYFDLAASYTWRSGIQVTLGVNNIFDQEPPLMPGIADVFELNLYGNYDPLGRHIFASLKFNF